MNNDNRPIMEGTRVLVFDNRLYKNDLVTPLTMTMKEATVVCRYGRPITKYSDDLTLGPYPDLVDVVFDHRPNEISKGHFTNGVEVICECVASTGICGCITRGTGKLNDYGYWQIECPHGNAYEPYECYCEAHGGHPKKTKAWQKQLIELLQIPVEARI